MKKLLFVAVLGVALASGAVFAESASAGKPSKPTSGATLSVSPASAAPWGAPYTVSGTGYEPDSGVQLGQSIAGGCCSTFVVRTDANGSFTLSGSTDQPGDYIFTASVYTRRGWKAVATATLHVQ